MGLNASVRKVSSLMSKDRDVLGLRLNVEMVKFKKVNFVTTGIKKIMMGVLKVVKYRISLVVMRYLLQFAIEILST